jgi:hypothetical protein
MIAAWMVAVCVAHGIGIQRFAFGTITVTLLPMVFAFFCALAMNPNIVRPLERFFGNAGSPLSAGMARMVGPAVLPLIVVFTAGVGSQAGEISKAGLALFLQELGNLGTMLISMPVAVLLFKLGRETIGATFSIAREGSIAIVFDRYGPNTPESTGVMAVYICGTFFGTTLFAILPPLVAALDWFDARALAMACGTGSASMTAACATSLSAALPENAELIGALAATSNLLSGVTGVFFCVFVAIPMAELYYKALLGHRLNVEGTDRVE